MSEQIDGLNLLADLGTGGARLRLCSSKTGAWVGDPVEVPWKTYQDTEGGGHIVMFGQSAGRTFAQALQKLIQANQTVADDKSRPLVAIGIGGHMHALFAVEADGQIAVPVQMWNSSAAAADGEALSKAAQWKIDRRLTASHLRRLMRGADPAFDATKVKFISTCAGYIGHLLTGVNGVGPCEGSGLGFNDPATGMVSDKVIASVAGTADNAELVKSWLPKILEPGEILGEVSEWSPLLSVLPEHWRKAIVAAPEGDQAMGRIALCRGPEDVSLVLGSSLVATTVAPQWGSRVDPTGTVDFFTDPQGLPMAMGLVTVGMRVGDRFVQEFANERFGGKVGSDVFAKLERLAREEMPISAEDFGVTFPVRDPALGISKPFEVAPPKAVSAGVQWNLILLQVAACIAIRLKQLIGNSNVSQLILGGAAARDNLLAEYIANATGIKVFRPEGGQDAMLVGARSLAMATTAVHSGAAPFTKALAALRTPQSGTTFSPSEPLQSLVHSHVEWVRKAITNNH